MKSFILKISNNYSKLDTIYPLVPLFARLSIGWVFLWAGYGKLGNLGQVIGYFESLGIPFASMQAPFVALIEMIGGLALILGVGTRLFSFLLANTMIVALLTAHIEDIKVFSVVFKIYEFVYILVFLFLIFKGAGSISLDNLIIKKYNK